MNPNLFFDFSVNKEKHSVHVTREFAAGIDLVWDAWTKPELLDQWWAPKPYTLKTKSMDFREGGTWLYAMISPENVPFYARADYKKIVNKVSFTAQDGFCDEEGNLNLEFPRSTWTNAFRAGGAKDRAGADGKKGGAAGAEAQKGAGAGVKKDGGAAGAEVKGGSGAGADGERTTVDITIQYKDLADLEKVISMGFKEGFSMALGNLDQYIEAQFRLRSEYKPDNKARVTTYLNFPGNTEEAFLFYQSVFKTAFIGGGIQRFDQAPAQPGQPPLADSVKRMVLHVELPITGGHILMGTDAPKEMGFTVIQGNNMHISLEPESRDEATRIFNELSAGGKIEMPMQDMFWGAYFGSFTDKYGINWFVNFQTKG